MIRDETRVSFHYGLPKKLNVIFEKIEHIISSFSDAHMNDAIFNFLMVIHNYKINKTYCEHQRHAFEKSYDQWIIEFDMLRNNEPKILMIRICIVSSFSSIGLICLNHPLTYC